MLLLIASCHGKYPLDSILANSQLGVALDPKLGKSNDINSESVTTANTASKQQQSGLQKKGVS